MTITRDDWLRALIEIGVHDGREEDPTALTINECAAMLNIKRDAAARRLSRLVESGGAERVLKRITTQNGRSVRLVAFRLTRRGAPHVP